MGVGEVRMNGAVQQPIKMFPLFLEIFRLKSQEGKNYLFDQFYGETSLMNVGTFYFPEAGQLKLKNIYIID